MNNHIEYFKQKIGKKYPDGGITKLEKKLIQTMLNLKFRHQDIHYIINYGRNTTINQGRIDGVLKINNITPISDDELEKYISKIHHIKTTNYRLKKSREAMINAIQIFNNPSMEFKYESFCVFSQIAWNGLLQEIIVEDFGEDSIINSNDKKKLSLTEMLKKLNGKLDEPTKANLSYIEKLRNLVEHSIDEVEFSNKPEINGIIQANIINFNKNISNLDIRLSLEEQLLFSLQFGGFDKEKVKSLQDSEKTVINLFCEKIKNNDYYDNTDFCFGIYYGKMRTSKSKADRVEVVNGSDDSKNTPKIILKDEKDKYLPGMIVSLIQEKGFEKFNMQKHTNLWTADKTKFRNEENKYGAKICRKWFWYEKWIQHVLKTLKEQEKQNNKSN